MNKDLKYMPIDNKAGTFMSKHCSPISYGTPLEKKSCGSPNKQIDPEKKKAYQDSIQKLHKPAHDAYVKKSKEGYYVDDTDGAGELTYIAPNSKPIIDLKEYAYRKEVAKGGTVKKDGFTAYDLAKKYK